MDQSQRNRDIGLTTVLTRGTETSKLLIELMVRKDWFAHKIW